MQVSYKHSIPIFCVLVLVLGINHIFSSKEKKTQTKPVIKSEKQFIKIDTEKEVEAFLLKNRKFYDVEHDGYIDFDKKELTYYDFGGQPFSFTNYKIDSLVTLSEKNKIREIEFINTVKDKKFSLKLSNEGTFTSYQVGESPLYIYSFCNK